MDEIFKEIGSRSQTQGIKIDLENIKKHHSQGLMSSVYTASSNRGDLIIHVVRPIAEHVRNKSWEKLTFLGQFLTQYPNISSAEVFLGGEVGDTYFIIQKMLAGTPAGSRALEGLEVVDTWLDPKSNEQIRQIQKILAELHTLPVNRFGWPVMRGGNLVGRFDTWMEFLNVEVPVWLESVRKADELTDLDPAHAVSVTEIERFTDYALTNIDEVSPSLVHGDAINPSNILIKGGVVSGLLDWEWSIFADRAWEFCDPGWEVVIREHGIDAYLSAAGLEDEKDMFLQRIKLHRPLWNLWGAHIHSGVTANKTEETLYRVLRNLLTKSLRDISFI